MVDLPEIDEELISSFKSADASQQSVVATLKVAQTHESFLQGRDRLQELEKKKQHGSQNVYSLEICLPVSRSQFLTFCYIIESGCSTMIRLCIFFSPVISTQHIKSCSIHNTLKVGILNFLAFFCLFSAKIRCLSTLKQVIFLISFYQKLLQYIPLVAFKLKSQMLCRYVVIELNCYALK